MNPEAQRIAIAEFCGWDMKPHESREWKSKSGWCKSPLGKLCIVGGTDFPDYLNDLNEIHEAESNLAPELRLKFVQLLVEYRDGFLLELFGDVCHVAAHKRAKALLKVIGKWKD